MAYSGRGSEAAPLAMNFADSRPAFPTWEAAHAVIPGVAFVILGGLVGLMAGSFHVGFLVITGPFAGGLARDWQSCCAEFSLSIAPWPMALLAAAVAVQFLVKPINPGLRWFRLGLWGLAWTFWFLSALWSYLHALE